MGTRRDDAASDDEKEGEKNSPTHIAEVSTETQAD